MIRLTICMVISAACFVSQAETPSTPSALGISFIDGSTSTFVVERDGQRYVVDLNTHAVVEEAVAAAGNESPPAGKAVFVRNCAVCHGADGKGKAEFKTPDFTDPKVQAGLTNEQIASAIRDGKRGTAMPPWKDKLSGEDIAAVAAYIRVLGTSNAQVMAGVPSAYTPVPDIYKPGDDVLISLPTGRPTDARGLYVNFTHRFAFDPAFSGPARGAILFGLDGVSISSFGFRYGITDKLSVSAYRSPSLIARPIQVMAGYSLLSESHGAPLNAMVRFSVEGQDNFSQNFTENIEGLFSRSLTKHSQIYFAPTWSFNNRKLMLTGSFESSAIPHLPGYNTLSTGVGIAVDIRPTLALVAEMIPTVVNGRPLDIHHPVYAFGIQKKIWHHAFTLGFSNSPGTTVSQRAGTRASYLDDPTADSFSKMFISFDLMRQVR